MLPTPVSVSLDHIASSVKHSPGAAILLGYGPMTILIDNDEWQAARGGWGGLERIDINVGDPVEVAGTCQRLNNTNSWVRYNVAVRIENQDDHLVRCHLCYAAEANTHLFHPNGEFNQDDFIWGEHILILEGNQDWGESIWNGEEGPGWITENLIGDRRRITTTRLQRAQAEFRNMLLAIDNGRCALTGETCQDALEAAHIVPVQCGGQEVLSNGILLRADLHRIYDAGHFDICAETGKVLVYPRYKSFDLAKARISETIRSRIAKALRKRANLCPVRSARRARR